MNVSVVPVSTTGQTGATICLTGFVVPREQIGIIQRGTHRLVDQSGNVIASLSSTTVNLSAFNNQFVTVCGVFEGRIEGVISLRVTNVFPANVPGMAPPPSQIDLRTLLLILLLANSGLLRGVRQDLLLALLFGSGLFGTSLLGSQGQTTISI